MDAILLEFASMCISPAPSYKRPRVLVGTKSNHGARDLDMARFWVKRAKGNYDEWDAKEMEASKADDTVLRFAPTKKRKERRRSNLILSLKTMSATTMVLIGRTETQQIGQYQ